MSRKDSGTAAPDSPMPIGGFFWPPDWPAMTRDNTWVYDGSRPWLKPWRPGDRAPKERSRGETG